MINWPGQSTLDWPGWVPKAAAHYIRHVEQGQSLRQLAQQSGCHPSTVLRQVRRLESRRDDPLVDSALRLLGISIAQKATVTRKGKSMAAQPKLDNHPTDDETLNREARRVLRRMSESGAVLAVVPDMEKAVVVRETASGSTQRTAVVDTEIAQAMALKEWITCKTPGRITRYHITAAGRAALSHLLAQDECQVQATTGRETPGRQPGRSGEGSRATGMAEAQAAFSAAPDMATAEKVRPRRPRVRYSANETPLTSLARRRTKDGTPFLSDDLVSAGERLREDFEIAQMAPRTTQNWDSFLTGGTDSGLASGDGPLATTEARRRVAEALGELGPGLGDVALRCCCYLEGLETTEQRMGWSARSGKIVLRIALQRLRRFYQDVQGGDAMIG